MGVNLDNIIETLKYSMIDLLKESMEGVIGDDLGKTKNEIDYRNYLIEKPIIFSTSNGEENADTGGGEYVASTVDFSNYKGGIISVDALMKIYPKANRNYAAASISALDKYGSKIGLTDKGKLMVLAQFAHESGNFKFTHELGYGRGRPYGRPSGPYGKIYYGRGPIQITWETNYKQITEKIFPQMGINANIHKDPDLCCSNLEIGCAASLAWFMLPGNGKRAIAAANAGDVKALTKAINGGYNGLQDRVNNTNKIFRSI